MQLNNHPEDRKLYCNWLKKQSTLRSYCRTASIMSFPGLLVGCRAVSQICQLVGMHLWCWLPSMSPATLHLWYKAESRGSRETGMGTEDLRKESCHLSQCYRCSAVLYSFHTASTRKWAHLVVQESQFRWETSNNKSGSTTTEPESIDKTPEAGIGMTLIFFPLGSTVLKRLFIARRSTITGFECNIEIVPNKHV